MILERLAARRGRTAGCQKRGRIGMDSVQLWQLFFMSGLPEAYSLYRLLCRAEAEEETVRERTA